MTQTASRSMARYWTWLTGGSTTAAFQIAEHYRGQGAVGSHGLTMADGTELERGTVGDTIGTTLGSGVGAILPPRSFGGQPLHPN